MSNESDGRIAKIVYDKYRNGDSIEDGELEVAAAFFTDVQSKLMCLGDTFRLAALEAYWTSESLNNFLAARKRRKN